MKEPKKHIVLRFASILIIALLLAPIGLKVIHIFEHEGHHACAETDTPNFHECETDCVFLKYNIQHHYIKHQNYNIVIPIEHNFNVIASKYAFFYNHRVLSFSLRGPPTLV